MKKKTFSEDKLINVGEPLPAAAMEMVVGGLSSRTTGDPVSTNGNTDSLDPSTDNMQGTDTANTTTIG